MNKYKIENKENYVKYIFPSNLGVLDPIVNETLLFLNDLSLDLFGVKLILFEALTNAVKHGNKLDDKLKVSFEIKKEVEELILIISDEGEGFDWSELIKKDMQDVTETSGRGIILMKAYNFIPAYNAKGNELTLRHKLDFREVKTQTLKRDDFKINALVVEDDPFSRKILGRLLEKFGDRDYAVNGEEAVELVKKSIKGNKTYDLICLDVMMPVMNGLDALKEIRKLEKENNISPCKIIMTTALDDRENIGNSFLEGCDGYLTKPIIKENLAEKLKEIEIV